MNIIPAIAVTYIMLFYLSVYLQQLQSKAECAKEGPGAEEETTANQNTEMAAAAEHPPDVTVRQDCHSNSSPETSSGNSDNLKKMVKVKFDEPSDKNCKHEENSGPGARPKNKILKRKNTPASLPKVDKLYCK